MIACTVLKRQIDDERAKIDDEVTCMPFPICSNCTSGRYPNKRTIYTVYTKFGTSCELDERDRYLWINSREW